MNNKINKKFLLKLLNDYYNTNDKEYYEIDSLSTNADKAYIQGKLHALDYVIELINLL